MKRFQDIWTEQSEAARGIMEAHGPLAALDYLVGEKLMTYVATAEDHPEFARELPKFVAAIRKIFGTDVNSAYVGHLEKIYREGEVAAREAAETGSEDVELFDGPEEWIKEGERLARLKELLTTERLGTA